MKQVYFFASVALCISPALSAPVSKDVPKEDAAFIMKALTAAPEAIGKKATIVRVNDGFDQTAVLQKGTNGWTCGIQPDDGIPYCADANAVAWYKAIYTKGTPPDKTGLIYMMTGDSGTSNHDPYATDKSHWVVTGPHIMVVGKAAGELAPMYPHTMDPDPTHPYVMFPDTPFQHMMIPVSVGMDHMK
jgi:hypothetical protein